MKNERKEKRTKREKNLYALTNGLGPPGTHAWKLIAARAAPL
jgi:hypothetical protein